MGARTAVPDHALGGQTVEVNIGPACRRHHVDKDRGWSLTQPEPGRFRWVSPLGCTYWTRGEPVRPDLPDPDPAPDPDRDGDTGARAGHRPRGLDPRILQRSASDRPRPPPPSRPDPPADLPPF